MARNDDPGVRVPSNGKPEFVMTGVQRPGGGVRLYASRELPADVGFGLRETSKGPVTHIDADLENVLVIDGKTWGQAFGRLFEVWENWDRSKALEEATERNRKQIIGAAGIPPATTKELDLD